MEELREKIADVFDRYTKSREVAEAAADRILNLPEIKEALQAKAMRDLQRLGQDFDNHTVRHSVYK